MEKSQCDLKHVRNKKLPNRLDDFIIQYQKIHLGMLRIFERNAKAKEHKKKSEGTAKAKKCKEICEKWGKKRKTKEGVNNAKPPKPKVGLKRLLTQPYSPIWLSNQRKTKCCGKTLPKQIQVFFGSLFYVSEPDACA